MEIQKLEDFKKFEVRVGTIKSAEKAEGADKLLKLRIEFGTEERQIMTAMAIYFPNPQILIGKQIPVLLNIEEKVFRGHVSQGMIIATDVKDKPIFLIPETPIPNGTPVI